MVRMFVVVIVILARLAAIAADKDVVEIREAIDATVRDLPQGKRAWPDYLREFGFRYDKNPSYGKMAGIVSNRFGCVAARFADIATNDIQRLMLLSCGWAHDERYYIDYYHLVADLAIKGDITAKDLRWYAVGHRSNKFLDLVARRCDDPRVSQLVDKICQISPAPVPPSYPEIRITPAPAFATPAAIVPTPVSETSLTEIRAFLFAFFKSNINCAKSSIE